jgi:DNA invertase Pin-like site-specific DNA recombinase
MEENWCAFFIATQLEVTPEQAFELYRDGKLGRYNRNITQVDVLEMISFKENGMTYKEIGYMYGISSNAVYRRIKYCEKKNGEVIKYA